jgi:hypothetical protein
MARIARLTSPLDRKLISQLEPCGVPVVDRTVVGSDLVGVRKKFRKVVVSEQRDAME